MPNQSGKIMLVLVLFLLVAGAGAYFSLPNFKEQKYQKVIPNSSVTYQSASETEKSSRLKDAYSSKDLKISFNYPNDWFVNEKDFDLMVSSFPTKFGSNAQPDANQIKFFINIFNGCHETIDENLKDPACGEGGPEIKPNVILSKETEDINGISYHRYLVKYPSGKQQKFYFLEEGDRILQVDKNPDPSVFDKEFEEIVRSIKFLGS